MIPNHSCLSTCLSVTEFPEEEGPIAWLPLILKTILQLLELQVYAFPAFCPEKLHLFPAV